MSCIPCTIKRSKYVCVPGRSGISMLAGTLVKAGYFMGKDQYAAHPSNPKGFIEYADVNGINEQLLAGIVPGRSRFISRWFFKDRPLQNQSWLAQLPPATRFDVTPELEIRIRNLTSRKPFCPKDPRFSYTLPVWRPFLIKHCVHLYVPMPGIHHRKHPKRD